ncbi:MAG: ribonuclease HI [Caldimicrobium sp.]|nr:ribonuclease HI [Caldimicrobium sp.]MCX7872877.1 ribonuclease HI [Caldimicrobium sp.]MDW8093545.1 ribonuclease HI [Caldimicrobium sp.]
MSPYLKLEELGKRIEYTFLKHIFERKDWELFLERAKTYPFRSICVPPHLIKEAKRVFPKKVVSVAGFPLGFQLLETKLKEIEDLFKESAEEVDFVINLSFVKARNKEALLRELELVRKISKDKVIKAIIETPWLRPEEIEFVISLLMATGIDYVKTSTGFWGKATTLEEIIFLKKLSQGRIKIKASGGIRDLDTALAFLDAGADLIGTSSGYEILRELETKSGEFPSPKDEVVDIYVDGCSLGNPGPGGYGIIIKDGNSEIVLSGGEPYTTNNRMELLAVIKALAYFKEPKKIRIHSDSEYVIKGATEWLPIWVKRGFKGANGKTIKNEDLWRELARWLKIHQVIFSKVLAHAGHPENERVDRIAKGEAKKWRKNS